MDVYANAPVGHKKRAVLNLAGVGGDVVDVDGKVVRIRSVQDVVMG